MVRKTDFMNENQMEIKLMPFCVLLFFTIIVNIIIIAIIITIVITIINSLCFYGSKLIQSTVPENAKV